MDAPENKAESEKSGRWASWIAAIVCIGFFGACLTIAGFVANAVRDKGFGWVVAILLGAAVGVLVTLFTIWAGGYIYLFLSSAVRRTRKRQ
jgi:hypothetical protein